MLFYLLSLIFSVVHVQSALVVENKNYYDLTDSFKNEYVGNPDDDSIIVRPCQVYDLNCIRHYFADHAKCKIVDGPIPDPLPRSQFTEYFPRINVSITKTNNIIYGLNTTSVEEFYENKKTDKVVFSINIKNLRVVNNVAYFKFYRNGREPIDIRSNATILYRSITFTAVIPNINDMQLDKAEVTTFADDGNPPFAVGPEVLTNPDPVVVQALAELMADMPTDVQELMLTEGQFYPAAYIQKNICDFGLLLVN